MGQILEYIKSAIKNIKNNKIRTALTMLGIVIGIMAVIVVITLGEGLKAYVSDEIDKMFTAQVDIMLDTSKTEERFDMDDRAAVKENFPQLLGVSYGISFDSVIEGRKGNFSAFVTTDTEDDYYADANEMLHGRYLSADDVAQGKHVCVLKEKDAKYLFGTADVVGQKITITSQGQSSEYEIVGIRATQKTVFDSMSSALEGDEEIFVQAQVPITTAGSDFQTPIDKFDDMILYTQKGISAKEVNDITTFLETRHGIRGQEALSSFNMSDMTSQIGGVMGTIQVFMSLVAGISLLVGGIGVMNIMLVSVTERTREIGIRKSIGARTSSVMIQFLAEASMLSLMGGIVGIILGMAGAAALCYKLSIPFIVNPTIIISATIFSMAIGVFFGIYPARKAAKMKPIDALSH